MRSMKLLVVSAVSLLALVGCNAGQPRIYRVALDRAPEKTISVPTCFRNSNLPNNRDVITEQSFREQNDWSLWDGVNGEQFLDMGEFSFKLGDSRAIKSSELIADNSVISGKDKSFVAAHSYTEPQGNNFTFAYQTQINVTFSDYSFSPVGTISLQSAYACLRGNNDCPGQGATPADVAPADAATCNVSLAFQARKIDVDQITAYGNNP